jgi:threonine dehydratase
MAGNGTIGLEILEDLPDVDAILVPWGGGGLSCGIAAAVSSVSPRTRVFATEIETAAPLEASLRAGTATEVDYRPSFVDGIGSKTVVPHMLELATRYLAGSLVTSVSETAMSVKLLAERNRVVAEGAGAVPVAAARSGRVDGRRLVCVVSGGNIDSHKLTTILDGKVP